MAKHGWKKFAEAHSNEKADEHMQKAAALISEAQSHLNAVRFGKQVVVDREHAVAADKMFGELKVAERTYHNYLVKQPLDRQVDGVRHGEFKDCGTITGRITNDTPNFTEHEKIHPGHQPEKFGADL